MLNSLRRGRNGEAEREASPEEAELLARINEQLAAPLKLAETARSLAKHSFAQQRKLRELADSVGRLRAEIEPLTAAPQPVGTVTDVFFENGVVQVQVHLPVNGKTWMGVHPDCPPDQLTLGAQVVVTHNRNAVLRVGPPSADWRDVAEFDRLLPGSERDLIVKIQGQQVHLRAADALDVAALRPGDEVGCDVQAGIAFVVLPKRRHENFFSEEPTETFADLAGLDGVVADIERVVGFQLLHPEIAARFALDAQKNILLIGPPGCGKTTIGRCTASYVRILRPEVPCRFVLMKAAEDLDPYLGQSEANLRRRFTMLRQAASCGENAVLFIDEIDAIAAARQSFDRVSGGATNRILNTFLSEISELRRFAEQTSGKPGHGRVLLIAGTNRADVLDPALVREGRFDRKLRIPTPNSAAVAAILGHYAAKRPLAEPLERAIGPLLSQLFAPRGLYRELVRVKLSDNRQISIPGGSLLSGAMLKGVVDDAAEAAAVRFVEGDRRGIATEDFERALEQKLMETARLLTPHNVKSYCETSIPHDSHPVSLEVTHRPVHQPSFVKVA